MKTVKIFDPPMCCSTGVCGPSVDPALVRFIADLKWLEGQGIKVERFNLAQAPGAFAEDETVSSLLKEKGEEALPLVMVEGAVVSSGAYPSREELAAFLGAGGAENSLMTPAVAELVAIGAAIASNCEPCFKHHYNKARKLGVSKKDMYRAVELAQMVKDSPARNMLETAEKYLGEPPLPSAPSCCGPPTANGTSDGCC
jgi:AhpD family alkylhydroperoxidase